MKLNHIVVITTLLSCFICTPAEYNSKFYPLLDEDDLLNFQRNNNRAKRQTEEETEMDISETDVEVSETDIEVSETERESSTREVEVTEVSEVEEQDGENGEDSGMPGNGQQDPSKPQRPNHRCRHKRKHLPYHKTCCGHRSMLRDLFDLRGPSMKQIMGSCKIQLKEKFRGKIRGKEANCKEKEDLRRKMVYCMHECIMKNREMVNDEGSIDFSQIRNELDRRWPQEEWIRAVVLRAVETCEGYNYDKAWMNDPEDIRCNPQSMELAECLWREIEQNCPTEYQSSKPKCKVLRETIGENN
ncbi:uncharacterized protein [Rhodnius prolixus]|uniref:uncharacterized protein n=1 Tax=Rhodnius prolixus TaxID=13249 RepID=UPI003D188FFB